MKHKSGRFKGAHGKELFYQSWRPDKAPQATLVLVHGFSDHCSRYMNLVHGLIPRGMVFYGYDQQGYGQSPGPRGYVNSFSEYREDLHTFMQLVREWEYKNPLFLMGQSMGGLIVLDYGLHHPQNLNGVIASAPHLSDPPISPIRAALGRLLADIWPARPFDANLDESAISRNPAVVQAYQDDPLVHGKGTPRLSKELSTAVIKTQTNARNFQPPLLIYHGSADRLTSPAASRQFFDNVPGGNKRYITYEGGYHECHNDLHQERVIIDVGQWIEEQILIASQQPQGQD